MGHYSKVTSKGQTTIPIEVRNYLGLKPGDRVSYTMRHGKVELSVRNLRAVDLAGILGPPPSGKTVSVEEMDEAIMDAVAEEDERIMREWREDTE